MAIRPYLPSRNQTLFGNAIVDKTPALRESELHEHVSTQARVWELDNCVK